MNYVVDNDEKTVSQSSDLLFMIKNFSFVLSVVRSVNEP